MASFAGSVVRSFGASGTSARAVSPRMDSTDARSARKLAVDSGECDHLDHRHNRCLVFRVDGKDPEPHTLFSDQLVQRFVIEPTPLKVSVVLVLVPAFTQPGFTGSAGLLG